MYSAGEFIGRVILTLLILIGGTSAFVGAIGGMTFNEENERVGCWMTIFGFPTFLGGIFLFEFLFH